MDEDGVRTEPLSDRAVQWCASGALEMACSDMASMAVHEDAILHLADVLKEGIVAYWNDRPGRTQAQVAKALRDAAKAARGELE